MLALADKDDGPLVAGRFQAWDYGPVLPNAYHKAKMFGKKPIKSFIFSGQGPIPEWERIFERTLGVFGDLTSAQLVAESHWQDGAWAEYYKPGYRGIEIPNGAILQEYERRTA